MCETPYKHKKNRHCRSAIAREKIFELLSALSIWALPSSGRWGVGLVAHRQWPRAAWRCCPSHFQWTQRTLTSSGFLVHPLLRLSEEMGLEQWQCLGMLLVVSRVGCRSPQGFICIAQSGPGQPRAGSRHNHVIWGLAEDTGCWESVFEAVASSSLSNPPSAFPTLLPQEALDCAQECIAELPQRLHLITKSDGLLEDISYFHINSTGQKKKKKKKRKLQYSVGHFRCISRGQCPVPGCSGCGNHDDFSCILPDGLFSSNSCMLHTCFPAPLFHF